VNGEIAGLLIEAGGPHDDFCHLIRIGVGSRTTIFEVTLSLFGYRTRHANTAAAVGNTGREIVNRRRFAAAGQTALVVLAFVRIVRLDMFDVTLGQFLDRLFDFTAKKEQVPVSAVVVKAF